MENNDYYYLSLQWICVVSPPSAGFSTTDEDETMIKRNANGRFLACMLAGLTLAMTVVAGSLGYAVYNSQAFF